MRWTASWRRRCSRPCAVSPRPGIGRSPLRIFRDQTDLSVSRVVVVDRSGAVRQPASILLASPRAAASKWVRRELDYWLSHRTPQTLLIVATEGTLEWNDAHKDFDWQHTSALPDNLAKVLRRRALYLNLRSISRAQDLAQDNPVFRDTVAALASVLLGRPKDELIGEDIAMRRRARRTAWAVGSALLTLTILLGLSTWFALSQRDSLARSLRVVQEQSWLLKHSWREPERNRVADQRAALAGRPIRLAPSTEAEAMLARPPHCCCRRSGASSHRVPTMRPAPWPPWRSAPTVAPSPRLAMDRAALVGHLPRDGNSNVHCIRSFCELRTGLWRSRQTDCSSSARRTSEASPSGTLPTARLRCIRNAGADQNHGAQRGRTSPGDRRL